MRVVFAPDSFKGSVAASAAAAALADGWRSARPADELILKPMADGGEGTLDTVAAAVPGAERVPLEVRGPDDRPVAAAWLRLPDGSALVELANTSGLLLLAKDPHGVPLLRPRTAHTVGTGQAIRAALDAGADRVYVALGGSASSDGGAGILAALGARLLDAAGRAVPPGNAGLAELAAVELRNAIPAPPPEGTGPRLIAWTDVRSPLLGPEGAVAVFGPQKGLRGADAEAAEGALARFAELLGGEPDAPGSGAAGGAAFGLAALGAELRGGAASVAEVIGLDATLAGCELVVTGEGSFDAQSAQGKAVSLVAELAAARGVPVALVAGRIEAAPDGFAAALSLTRIAADAGGSGPASDPIRDAEALLRRAGGALARSCGAARQW